MHAHFATATRACRSLRRELHVPQFQLSPPQNRCVDAQLDEEYKEASEERPGRVAAAWVFIFSFSTMQSELNKRIRISPLRGLTNKTSHNGVTLWRLSGKPPTSSSSAQATAGEKDVAGRAAFGDCSPNRIYLPCQKFHSGFKCLKPVLPPPPSLLSYHNHIATHTHTHTHEFWFCLGFLCQLLLL